MELIAKKDYFKRTLARKPRELQDEKKLKKWEKDVGKISQILHELCQ